MPIYEYRCADCGFQDEYLQKVSEAPLTACPSCGKPSLRKLVSAAGFQLKGSGWYATDFKGSGKAAAKPGAQGEAKAEAKPDAKAEAKPESKAEPKTEAKPQAAKSPAAANSDS
ncbi:MAG: zinc ribbon domain-containing protein [Betaproteobacteria bacterium]|nr:zinc ribbon domain-containing protein [Betaproteobacteria bacterium]MDH4322948.1 zinc ribbon domain-containing protein [Betaproteobacteria bacterium]MDH5577379.1 zinc ribbon domain-containing protein [Betaproteobacteria bacterium]